MTQVEIHCDGTTSITERLSSGDVVRSDDYKTEGLKVQDGFGSRTVTDASQLRGDEIITVEGMSMKASQARELGLLNKAIDESLSIGAAAAAAHNKAAQPAEAPTALDPVTAGHEAAIEAGQMTTAEANVHSTAIGELMLAGYDVDQGIDLINQVAEGELGDLTPDQQQVAAVVEANVTKAAMSAAQAELGQAAFSYLQDASASSPDVAEAVRSYAIKRATGRTEGLTFTDLYRDILAHTAGGTE